MSELNIQPDTLIHAVRYYIGERTGDLTEEEMRERMAADAGDPAAVDAALALAGLESNAALLKRASHEVLQGAWDEGDEERVRGAVEGAKSALPVIETAMVAMAAMYGNVSLHYRRKEI